MERCDSLVWRSSCCSPKSRPVLQEHLELLIGAVFLQILVARRGIGAADRKGMLLGDQPDFLPDFLPLCLRGGLVSGVLAFRRGHPVNKRLHLPEQAQVIQAGTNEGDAFAIFLFAAGGLFRGVRI